MFTYSFLTSSKIHWSEANMTSRRRIVRKPFTKWTDEIAKCGQPIDASGEWSFIASFLSVL